MKKYCCTMCGTIFVSADPIERVACPNCGKQENYKVIERPATGEELIIFRLHQLYAQTDEVMIDLMHQDSSNCGCTKETMCVYHRGVLDHVDHAIEDLLLALRKAARIE